MLRSPGRPWLPPSPAPQAPVRLLCLPHAGGGGTFFRSWQLELAPSVDVLPVLLPGRESRLGEPAPRRMDDLVPALLQGVRAHLDRPYGLFGHSMGAVVAFELARAVRAAGLPAPVHLFVSARRAPHLPPRRAGLADLDDAAFVRMVRDLGGTPEEVFAQPELLQVFLPTLRADFTLNDTYRPAPGEPLTCPVTAFVGSDDAEASPAEVAAWAGTTTGVFSARVFRGGHFYLLENAAQLLGILHAGLGGVPPGVSGPVLTL